MKRQSQAFHLLIHTHHIENTLWSKFISKILREFRVGTPQVIGASFAQRFREKFAIQSILIQFVAITLSLHAKHIRIFLAE